MEIITRQHAAETGSYRYFTGKPCKHGHLAPRYTTTCVCVECHRNASNNQRAVIMEKFPNVESVRIRAHVDDHKALIEYATMLNAARGLSPQQFQPVAAKVNRAGLSIPDTTTKEYRDAVNRSNAEHHARLRNLPPPATAQHIPAEFAKFLT